MIPKAEQVRVAGLNLAYRRTGIGRPLVLLHGAYEDGRIWRRQFDGLADEFAMIAWDSPGCGLSDDPPESFTAADYGACLHGLLDALRVERPYVLGLSWGSTLALEFYRGYPDVPAALVLASAYAGWAGSLPPEEVQRRVAQVLREVELPPEQFVPSWIPTLLTASAPPELVGEVTAIMCDFHPAGTRAAVRGQGMVDYRGMLSSISVPTLLLYGDADVRSPVSVGEELHARIARSRLIVLPDAPHLSNVEKPAMFNAAVRDFLRTVPR